MSVVLTAEDLRLVRTFIESELRQLNERVWDLSRNAYRNGDQLAACAKLLDQRHKTLARVEAVLMQIREEGE